MTREETYYAQIKLVCDCFDTYDEWLNAYLETENPLSDIVLALLDCRGDREKVIRVLNLFCLEKAFDQEKVYARLRMELCRRYEEHMMTLDEVMTTLYRYSQKISHCDFQEACNMLSDCYYLAKNGGSDMHSINDVDRMTKSWLKNGGIIVWNKAEEM